MKETEGLLSKKFSLVNTFHQKKVMDYLILITQPGDTIVL